MFNKKFIHKFIGALFTLFISLLLFNTNIVFKASASDEYRIDCSSEKIYTNASIDEEFDDCSVLVVMKKEISQVNKKYDISFFGDFPIESIDDLTYISGGITEKTKINKDGFTQILQIKLPIHSKQNVLDVIKKLERIDEILWAGPNHIESSMRQPISANTPPSGMHRYPDLWAMHNSLGIQAEKAWDFTVGNSNIRVGVIDSGMDNHNDISANRSVDGGDFVNMADSTHNIPGPLRADPDGHGTHVSGTIGATGTNPNGVTGVAWNVQLVPLQVSYWDSSASDWRWCVDAVTRAITWAIANNIDIINYSGGGTNDNIARRNAMNNFDGLFVVAAGNGGTDGVGDNNDTTHYYPSDYSRGQDFSDRVISVGAYECVTESGLDTIARCNFSNFGKQSVSIFAPGRNILSTLPASISATGYGSLSGTSMATPHVTGVAALMLSINPNLTPQQIKATIMNNATKYSALDDLCVCEGRLDAYKAIVAVALDTETISDNIKIVGFVNEYTPPSNMELTITESFAQVSSTYGTQEQEVQIIDNLAFSGYADIKSVKLPNTMTAIGSYAFEGCTSLENVTILKEKAPIPNLGLHAFDNCASNLTITVPINRLCQYKNTPLWSIYKNKIVPSSNIDSSINIDCMSNFDETVYLNAGYNKLYELNVECNGWYTISCSSGARFNIYNSNMEIIASSNNLYELTLSEGIYYIDVEWEDIEDYGNVTLHFFNKGISVTDNINNNILPHLHSTGTNYKAQLKYYHNQGAGYYKFSLSATSNTNNPVNYNYGAITMYTDYNRSTIMNKYSDNNYTLQAKSLEYENSLIVYLPSNGYYYFDVNMGTNNLSSLVLNITSCAFSEMNLFDFSVSANDIETVINSNIEGDYFKKISLKQTGKFIISSTYTDNDIDNISLSNVIVVVSKVIYNQSTNTYSFTKIYSVNYREIIMLDPNYVPPSPLEIVLESGTYYAGYFNNIDCADIKIDFERKITQYGSYNLISDPDQYEDYGSEVRFNNGSFLGTTLTVGFTRFIYLNYDYILPSYSRLDYYFYSSNESIASISEYGTLLGRSVGTVKIMVVYKNNPSIAFVKEFTVLADSRVNDLIIYNTDTLVYSESGELYQVDLTDTNSFYPQNTLYNWSIVSSNNYNYSISEWGTIILNGDDIIVIEGVSELNSKLKIRLTLTIT